MALRCLDGSDYPLSPTKSIQADPSGWFYYNEDAFFITSRAGDWLTLLSAKHHGKEGRGDNTYPFQRIDLGLRRLDGTPLP